VIAVPTFSKKNSLFVKLSYQKKASVFYLTPASDNIVVKGNSAQPSKSKIEDGSPS